MTLAQGIICPLDERLVRRSIHNLIENAVQAMEQNGKLILDLSREDSFALLTIQDNGPGIAPEDNQRIFEAYFSTKDQGTGLGLAIAKKTIEEHGGSLMIDTNYTTGARVVVRLPLM